MNQINRDFEEMKRLQTDNPFDLISFFELWGSGGGVNPILVSDDIQNMRLFHSHPANPNVPEELFHFTLSPCSA